MGDGLYEEIQTNGKTIKKSYVGNYYVQKIEDNKKEVSYLHRDNLGSVEAISDSDGIFVSRMAFDPWGDRLEEDWRDGDPTIGMPLHYPTQEGYTGHEQLDQLGLIHMGGRVYDPVISRFLSADLFIQAPGNTQSYNRYSYVLNNPLSMVDPSGYVATMASNMSLRMFPTIDQVWNRTFYQGFNQEMTWHNQIMFDPQSELGEPNLNSPFSYITHSLPPWVIRLGEDEKDTEEKEKEEKSEPKTSWVTWLKNLFGLKGGKPGNVAASVTGTVTQVGIKALDPEMGEAGKVIAVNNALNLCVNSGTCDSAEDPLEVRNMLSEGDYEGIIDFFESKGENKEAPSTNTPNFNF